VRRVIWFFITSKQSVRYPLDAKAEVEVVVDLGKHRVILEEEDSDLEGGFND